MTDKYCLSEGHGKKRLKKERCYTYDKLCTILVRSYVAGSSLGDAIGTWVWAGMGWDFEPDLFWYALCDN
jgi:hypothetical protein